MRAWRLVHALELLLELVYLEYHSEQCSEWYISASTWNYVEVPLVTILADQYTLAVTLELLKAGRVGGFFTPNKTAVYTKEKW